MQKQTFDAIVIGTGQSGPSLAVRLAKEGQKVAVIERARFGGTCVNTGCIPTKAMVASARTAYVAKRAADFGVVIDGGIRVDIPKVMARKEAISLQSRTGVEKWLTSTVNCTVFRGHGRFLANERVQVGDDVLEASQIFINVGGRATIPAMSGLNQVNYLTNSSILNLSVLPGHLLVVGGGYIGLEFGQMFRRFGSEVTILHRESSLLGNEDDDVSQGVEAILRNEGIGVHLNAGELSVQKRREGIEVKGASFSVAGTHLLLATGRRPNTDDLGLENTTIRSDAKGFIEVDDQLRTTAPGVWAIGDCNGHGGFTHTSYNDFEIVAANLFEKDKRSVKDRIMAYAVFIDPPLGRVGLTEKDVRRSGRKALLAKREMTRVGRAVEKGETQGFMKILVDAESERILGAAILGTDGDEAIHCILDLMYADAPYTTLKRAVHIHPTVSELIPTMLGDLQPLA